MTTRMQTRTAPASCRPRTARKRPRTSTRATTRRRRACRRPARGRWTCWGRSWTR
ncbi:DENN domain containing 1B [Phyllostomus discolor]|uniref:DENN domain containing 1B n=1 Tax=Phyllostomus discolor TaxID=89673 RepID=A0A833YG99_9CHIR|nr:DENN domain containing 1B [Phyllostomus discolor]